MKKTALAMAVMFAISSLGFAGEGKFGKGCKNMDPEQKAKWEAMKKEKSEYFKNVQTLVDKYNKASDKNKESVKKEITALVSTQTDKDLVAKKEMISKMQEKISEIETDKTAYVNKKVDFLLSPEGQEKMQKMKEHKNKDGKDRKKDFKKTKSEPKSK